MAKNFASARLEAILDKVEPRLRLEFLAIVGLLRETDDLETLARLLSQGRISEALRNLTRSANRLAAVWSSGFNQAAEETARFLNSIEGVIIDYDQANLRAITRMRENRLRLVREFSEAQRHATREALIEGMLLGENPRTMARRFRDSIGLSPTQARALDNYRRALETGDRSALERALRDRRFDPTVERMLRGGGSLTAAQIDRMSERYRTRLLNHRADVIARTEALRSVHEGNHEMFQQAIDAGELDPNNLVQTWNTARDTRVRDTHRTMHGQEKPWGEPFVSGSGAKLKHPGDANAPASETIQCRCALGTRIRDLDDVGAFSVTVVEE